jgi:hypothetical protein
MGRGQQGGLASCAPDSSASALARRAAAERTAHRLLLQVDRLREEGVTSRQALAKALTERGVLTPRGGTIRRWGGSWREQLQLIALQAMPTESHVRSAPYGSTLANEPPLAG